MTSIGLNITGNTRYYPVATTMAAIANIGLNFALIPRYGIMGAAYANGIAYAAQAAIAYRFSQRFYPMSYERGRIVRVLAAAVARLRRRARAPDDAPDRRRPRSRDDGRRS